MPSNGKGINSDILTEKFSVRMDRFQTFLIPAMPSNTDIIKLFDNKKLVSNLPYSRYAFKLIDARNPDHSMRCKGSFQKIAALQSYLVCNKPPA